MENGKERQSECAGTRAGNLRNAGFERRVVIAWILVAAWAIAIFVMSAKSGLELDKGSGILSLAKAWLAGVLAQWFGREVDPSPIGHFGEYLVFGALLVNALRYHLPLRSVPWAAIGIAVVYAATDEFHQMFVPGRACDPVDWIVDVGAVAVIALVGCAVFSRRSTQRKGDMLTGN